jgi:hypothetical protein
MIDSNIIRADESDIGCLVDGWLGQYAGASMVLVATCFGYADNEVIDVARRHYDSMGSRDELGITDDEHGKLSDMVDEVESWLNEHVAADGYAFGWHDGEFFYQPTTSWEDETW